MVALQRPDDVELLLLTTPDDTEDAPWMVMPDFQWRVVALLMSILRLHARRAGLRWYLMAELKVTMPRPDGERTLDLGPDLMMAEAEDIERDSWDVPAEGPPLFVLEVVTDQSRKRDLDEKPLFYDRMGVREYAIFAPRLKGKRPKLFGYRRDDEGRFVAWDADADSTLWSTSLDLGLYVEEGKWLRVRDAGGRRLPSAEDEALRAEQEARRTEEATLRAEQEARRAQQEARRARQETEARLRAEAEVERLHALLRQQAGG